LPILYYKHTDFISDADSPMQINTLYAMQHFCFLWILILSACRDNQLVLMVHIVKKWKR